MRSRTVPGHQPGRPHDHLGMPTGAGPSRTSPRSPWAISYCRAASSPSAPRLLCRAQYPIRGGGIWIGRARPPGVRHPDKHPSLWYSRAATERRPGSLLSRQIRLVVGRHRSMVDGDAATQDGREPQGHLARQVSLGTAARALWSIRHKGRPNPHRGCDVAASIQRRLPRRGECQALSVHRVHVGVVVIDPPGSEQVRPASRSNPWTTGAATGGCAAHVIPDPVVAEPRTGRGSALYGHNPIIHGENGHSWEPGPWPRSGGRLQGRAWLAD